MNCLGFTVFDKVTKVELISLLLHFFWETLAVAENQRKPVPRGTGIERLRGACCSTGTVSGD